MKKRGILLILQMLFFPLPCLSKGLITYCQKVHIDFKEENIYNFNIY